jgi:hypothetical protein
MSSNGFEEGEIVEIKTPTVTAKYTCSNCGHQWMLSSNASNAESGDVTIDSCLVCNPPELSET